MLARLAARARLGIQDREGEPSQRAANRGQGMPLRLAAGLPGYFSFLNEAAIRAGVSVGLLYCSTMMPRISFSSRPAKALAVKADLMAR
jgi:hypothetical protein